jgi:hypothetical protein
MSLFSVRDSDENVVANYDNFEEAWNYLQLDLEGDGDIVEGAENDK